LGNETIGFILQNIKGDIIFRYFLGFLISLVLLGISEIAGFLLRLIIIFGQGVDNINQSSSLFKSCCFLYYLFSGDEFNFGFGGYLHYFNPNRNRYNMFIRFMLLPYSPGCEVSKIQGRFLINL